MLVILQAIRMWRPYIIGRKFFIQTDKKKSQIPFGATYGNTGTTKMDCKAARI